MSTTKQSLPDAVSAAQICWLLDMTPGRLSQMVRDGLIKRVGRDQYALSSVPAVVGAMRNRGDGPKAWSDARTRLMLARARLVEMETKEKQGLLIPADQLGECWLAAYSALRMTLLVVPARLGSQVGMCRDATEIAGLARRLLNEAMDSYARMPVLIGSEEVTAEEAEEIDDEPSAGPSH